MITVYILLMGAIRGEVRVMRLYLFFPNRLDSCHNIFFPGSGGVKALTSKWREADDFPCEKAPTSFLREGLSDAKKILTFFFTYNSPHKSRPAVLQT